MVVVVITVVVVQLKQFKYTFALSEKEKKGLRIDTVPIDKVLLQ
jgi:hypothetical protein